MKVVLFVISLLLFGALSLASPQVAFACSGYTEPDTFEGNVAIASVIVDAIVVEVDDASKNAILQVQHYLKGGSGSEFLLLYDIDPVLSAVYAAGYDTGCTYDGSSYDANPSPSIGMHAYFLLNRMSNGSYTYVSRGGPSFVELQEMTDFEEQVATLTGEEVSEPNNSLRPLISPLAITTRDGNSFLLPVDGNDLISYSGNVPLVMNSSMINAYPNFYDPLPHCYEVGCQMGIADRSYYGEITAQNTIEFNYPYSNLGSTQDGAIQPIVVEGYAFGFSPNGETALVWRQDQLAIYSIVNGWCMCNQGYSVASIRLMAEIPLNIGYISPEIPFWESVRWSEDGSTLMYANLDGLWLIDVYRESTPQLVVRTGGQRPTPLFLSTTGHYYAYTLDVESNSWITVDRINGATYPNSVPSESERYLATFLGSDGVGVPSPDTFGNQCFQLPCSLTLRPNPDFYMWIDMNGQDMYLSTRCGDSRNPSDNGTTDLNCEITTSIFDNNDVTLPYPRNREYERLHDVTYDTYTGNIAYITREYTLIINDTEYDFSSQIDAEITSIQWLPPLFYYR